MLMLAIIESTSTSSTVGLAWEYLQSGTLCGFSRLYDTISKVRARQCTRNEQGYNSTLVTTAVRRSARPAAGPLILLTRWTPQPCIRDG